MINSRLSVAIHILALISFKPHEQMSSEHIALSINTNPVVVRRISSLLKKGGIIKSRAGVSGATLTKEPANITLLEIYTAVQTHEKLFALHEKTNPKCFIGSRIQSTLDTTFTDVQKAMENELANITLNDIMMNLAYQKTNA
jgi:Rrf2 family protein